jgi:hypothetical protein
MTRQITLSNIHINFDSHLQPSSTQCYLGKKFLAKQQDPSTWFLYAYYDFYLHNIVYIFISVEPERLF